MKKIRLIIISLLAGMCTPALSTPVNVTDTIQVTGSFKPSGLFPPALQK